MKNRSRVFPLSIVNVGIALFLIATSPSTPSSYANDSAAEFAAGGIQFKEEKAISIEKEELFISRKKIEVNYLFRNHSKKDITTVIAFPVPEYQCGLSGRQPFFDDFVVEVNGRKIQYDKEIRAFVGGKEYTKLLEEMNVSIGDFGSGPMEKPDFFSKLSEKDKATLIKLGIAGNYPVEGWPRWTVSKKYHWSQKFPANRTIHIRHTYTPYYGFKPVQFDMNHEEALLVLKEACVNKETLEWIRTNGVISGFFHPEWVSYILLTANNWRKPIGSFHLTVENSQNGRSSFCLDHKMTRSSPTRQEVFVKDYIPKKNLTVFFFKKVEKTQ